MNNLALAVTHLNAPYGEVLSIEQLRSALCAGSLNAVPDPTCQAVLASLFVEMEPRLIVLCATEAGSNVARVNMLYRETLEQHSPRVPAWENVAREFQ